MYCVEAESKNVGTTILFPAKFSRCYGFKLKEAAKYQIHYFRRPSKIMKVTFREAVETLYATRSSSPIRPLDYLRKSTTKPMYARYSTRLQKPNSIKSSMEADFTSSASQSRKCRRKSCYRTPKPRMVRSCMCWLSRSRND